jgi:hypothetical protein
VIIVSIVGEDPFHSFKIVAKSKLQFRRPNLIHKLDERLMKLINVIEYTTCKRCFGMTEKPAVEWPNSGLYGR